MLRQGGRRSAAAFGRLVLRLRRGRSWRAGIRVRLQRAMTRIMLVRVVCLISTFAILTPHASVLHQNLLHVVVQLVTCRRSHFVQSRAQDRAQSYARPSSLVACGSSTWITRRSGSIPRVDDGVRDRDVVALRDDTGAGHIEDILRWSTRTILLDHRNHQDQALGL